MIYVFNALNTSSVNDGQGDGLRTAMIKVNNMLQQLMVTQEIVQTGTANKIFATPNAATGYPSFRAIAVSDLPIQLTAGAIGGVTEVPRITYNAQGLITAVTSYQIGYSTGYRDVDVEYKNATTVTIKAGSKCRDVADTWNISCTADLDVALTTSGANGLDTGVEAAAWYYLYLIATTAGDVAGLLSRVDESTTGSITLPTGYVKKRQVPIAIKNGITSAAGVGVVEDILPFLYNPNNAEVTYTTAGHPQLPPTNATGLALNSVTLAPTYAGNCTSGADANYVVCGTATLFIPPIASIAEVRIGFTNGNTMYFRGTGSGQNFISYNAGTIHHEPTRMYVPQQLVEVGNQISQVHWCLVYGYTVTKRIP